MRVSSCFLLCLLSASLVSSIVVVDVPRTALNGDEISLDPIYDDADIMFPETEPESGRRLLISIKKAVKKVFSSPPPPPPPPPAPKKAAPAPAPKAAPAPTPKAAPKADTKPDAKSSPKAVSVPVVAAVAASPVVAAVSASPVVAAVSASPVVAAVAASPVVAAVSASPVVAAVSASPVVAAPAPAPAPATVPVFFTCDNEFEMFVNGNKVGSGSSWTTTYKFSFQVGPGDVIAIDGVDKGGPAAFIGVFGGKPTKSADWRCSTKETAGWKLNSFDDSAWPNAVSYGRNQDNNIWRSVGGGSRPNIPGDAEWLWTSNNDNHDRVYCRYQMTPAPVAARVVAPVVVVPAPAPATKQTVIDEIIREKEKATSKMSKFQEKLLALLKENSDEQVKLETENRNNFNGVSATLKNEQLRLEAARGHMKKLYDETQNLNSTIQKHYKKLIADTDYLQSLDAMRPSFLKSLDELASHIQNVKTVVDNKIVKDEYKDEMVRLLTGIHFNTHNISGYVATAFINHYNKYKALIQKENTDYSNELKRLTQLSNEYKVQVQLSADIEKERARLEGILSKLKDTLQLSITQREEFDLLVKEVMAIFDKKRC